MKFIDSLFILDQLEEKYFSFVTSIKSKLKFRIAKYERSYEIWNEFDKYARKLGIIFRHTVFSILSDVEVST